MRRPLIALAMVAATASLPVAANAATRPVQAVDSRVRGTYWTPSEMRAQQHDSIEWRLTQPGNPIAGSHDIWLVAPNSNPVQLGTTAANPIVTAPVDMLGEYHFYCSIHGGLTDGGMNGKVTVEADDPGPAADPGMPWVTGDAPSPSANADLTLPPAFNPTVAPALFEEGDVLRPRLTAVRVSAVRKGVRVRFTISEPATLSLRLTRGSTRVKSRSVRVKAGANSVTLETASKLRAGRYRVWLQATDFADLESLASSARLRIR